DSPNSNDRDAGFCSASSESEGGDDLAVEHAHRATSGSPALTLLGSTKGVPQESPECKPIALVRNKRKSSEPLKVVGSNSSSLSGGPLLPCPSSTSGMSGATGPLKKRIRYTSSADSAVVLTPPAVDSPPPSNHPAIPVTMRLQPEELAPNPAHVFVRHPGVTTLHRPLFEAAHPEQLEPLALVTNKKSPGHVDAKPPTPKKALPKKAPRVAAGPLQDLCEEEEKVLDQQTHPHPHPLPLPHQQRNYKNMTRERRIEANARERTRVHTISAAYETLRRAVPAYASSQKLSKLSVLRVACSYILTLSRMAGEDYSADQSEPSIAECVDSVTATIQTEGKVKRRKDE
ncbi:hypothetical protein KR018_008355, partial [Drosophila ironensis]